MSEKPNHPPVHATWQMHEERFSLAELMLEVSAEKLSGGLSAQKMKQRDIQNIFDAKASSKNPDETQS